VMYQFLCQGFKQEKRKGYLQRLAGQEGDTPWD
jgi:hypothetical protein